MNLNEFIERIRIAQDRLPNLLLLSYIELAHDGKAMIESRITETGVNAHGATLESIKPYSLSYLKVKQNFTVGGKGKVKAGKKKDADGNSLQGRYTGIVNINLSGRLWQNIGVLIDEANVSQKGILVPVGANSQENKDKLAGNVYGNAEWHGRGEILELSEDELNFLAHNLELNLQDHFNSFFQ